MDRQQRKQQQRISTTRIFPDLHNNKVQVVFFARNVPFLGARATTTTTTTTTIFSTDSSNLNDNEREEEEESWDTIVIGSGIGGMAVASLLSQCKNHENGRGGGILVLEQHDRMGGCCHSFVAKGKRSNKTYTFGVGIHYVGEMNLQNNNDKNKVRGKRKNGKDLGIQELLNAVTPLQQPIVWSPLADNFDVVFISNNDDDNNNKNEKNQKFRRYDMIARQQSEALQQQFPDPQNVKSIQRYFDWIDKAQRAGRRSLLFKALPRRVVKLLLNTGIYRFLDRGYGKYAKISLQQVVQSLTDHKELQSILMYAWGDYGAPPHRAPFVTHALLTSHYQQGASYPQGGPSEIPKRIAAVIRERGGEIRVHMAVRQIWVEEDNDDDDNGGGGRRRRVAGVYLENGRRIRAKTVISTAGFLNTYKYLVPKQYQTDSIRALLTQPNDEQQSKLRASTTGIALFVGLEGDHDQVYQLPKHQIWAFYDGTEMGADVEWTSGQLPDKLPIFIGSPSGKDSSWSQSHPNRTTLEILTAAPWEWFQGWAPNHNNSTSSPLRDDTSHVDQGGPPGSHGEQYQHRKKELMQLLWQRSRQVLIEAGASERHLPVLVEDADFADLGTPLTFAHYLRSEHGAFYGLEHSLERFDPKTFFLELRPECPHLPGLFLSGQDVAMCGMAGAMIGAYLCASKVLGVPNPYSLLKKVDVNRVESSSLLD